MYITLLQDFANLNYFAKGTNHKMFLRKWLPNSTKYFTSIHVIIINTIVRCTKTNEFIVQPIYIEFI